MDLLKKSQEPWQKAFKILLQLENPHKKLGEYLQKLSENGTGRAYVLNVVKHRRCFDYFLQKNLKRKSKTNLRCFVKLVMGQLWQLYFQENGNLEWAPLINGWVERAKRYFSIPECRCINALFRKILPYFQQIDSLPLSIRCNTPDFILERYRKFYGETALLEFLKWNEGFVPIYIHTENTCTFLQPTAWPGFYTFKESRHWPKIFSKIRQGRAYIQDPMTRIPVEYLELKPGIRVLDLCAAPGGKTIQIAQKLKTTGCIYAVDLPEHTKRLKKNLRAYPQVKIVAKNIFDLTPEDFQGLTFDRILLDAPCSNTGVIRRKPDIVDRLKPQDFQNLPELQYQLLKKASHFLKKQGLLVYSTCSIDLDENEGVINRFLKNNPNFLLKSSHISLPWVDHHDGGGCFCLLRNT